MASDDETGGSVNGVTVAPCGGYFLRWSRLHKTVEVKDLSGGLLTSSIAGPAAPVSANASPTGSSTFSLASLARRTSTTTPTPKRVILDRVSGCAAPGQVLAIMGPSGSGKTSLLNMLSGRGAFQSGTLSINGEILTSVKKWQGQIAYVKQADIFFQHLTVRDQFTYTALLRLPSINMTQAQKLQEVDRIIKLLRLNKVAQTPIKMLSGGEKKRVNIGTELLTTPAIILLDEPTSGLDSTSAVALMKLLHRLAGDSRAPKTILTSIHQPSSAVFRSFDQLLLLSNGKVVYFGSPVASLDYLRSHNLACPDGYNAADHWMDVLLMDDSPHHGNDQTGDDEDEDDENDQHPDNNHPKPEEVEGLLPPKPPLPRVQLEEAWDHEAVAERMDAAILDLGETTKSASSGEGGGLVPPTASATKYNTSWATQYWILTHRSMKNSRSAIFTTLNLTKSVCIGLVSGLLWWQMEYTERTVRDRSAYFFFTMTYWVFDSMFGALMAFPPERAVVLKERASGSYHLSAYFLAKISSDAPVRLTLPFLYMCTSYWMAGVDPRFSVFLSITCCTLLSVMAGEALGLLVGASIHDVTKALTITTVGGLLLMLLGGFYVENVPVFMAWVQFLSPYKYAFAGSLQLVFADDVPCDGSGNLEDLCGGRDFGWAKASDVVAFLGVQGSLGFNIGMLLVICMVPRYGAYLALRHQNGGERS